VETSKKKYDLTGVNGAHVFRELPEGLKLRLTDGSIVQIIANAKDGAILNVKVLERPNNPSAVGEEEFTYFTDVAEVVEE
jgi:hypothetical protein